MIYNDVKRLESLENSSVCLREEYLYDPYHKIRYLAYCTYSDKLTNNQLYEKEQLELYYSNKEFSEDYIKASIELKNKYSISFDVYDNIQYNLGLSIKHIPNEYITSNEDIRKCDRCWSQCTTIGNYIEHPDLCEHCVTILYEVYYGDTYGTYTRNLNKAKKIYDMSYSKDDIRYKEFNNEDSLWDVNFGKDYWEYREAKWMLDKNTDNILNQIKNSQFLKDYIVNTLLLKPIPNGVSLPIDIIDVFNKDYLFER